MEHIVWAGTGRGLVRAVVLAITIIIIHLKYQAINSNLNWYCIGTNVFYLTVGYSETTFQAGELALRIRPIFVDIPEPNSRNLGPNKLAPSPPGIREGVGYHVILWRFQKTLGFAEEDDAQNLTDEIDDADDDDGHDDHGRDFARKPPPDEEGKLAVDSFPLHCHVISS